MKKIILIALTLLSVTINAQTYDLTSHQTNITERNPIQTIVIQPSTGENSDPVGIITCYTTSGDWYGDCYSVQVVCTNGQGLSIQINVIQCIQEIASKVSQLSNNPKNELLDLNYKYVGATIPSDIDNLYLQKIKNESIVIPQDSYYKGKDANVLIKAGTYKIKNAKLHTLMSIQ